MITPLLLVLPVVLGEPIEVRVGGELFARVVYEGAQSPYVYPLLGPGSVRMTRGFPMDPQPDEAEDHPHHRSFWFTHGDVNGLDFWHPGEHSGTIETVDREVSEEKDSVRVKLELRWVDGERKPLLAETRTLVFRIVGEDERHVDFTTELRALEEPVVFGDTKEGSFALRVHPQLRFEGPVAHGSMKNSEGVEGAEVWGKRARWVHYSGPIDGEPVGIAVLDHPDNPRHPTWWHARTYGLFAANPFGRKAFGEKESGELRLEPGETLRLRYRVILHSGERSKEELDAAFERFRDGS